MRLIEIQTQFFTTDSRTIALLESYADPNNELEISFNPSSVDKSTFFGVVREKHSGIPVVEVVLTLNGDNITIGNIIPGDHPKHDKLVHTSLGTQNNGVDPGLRGVRWLFDKIKVFATTNGYNIQRLNTTSRFTGARAKNNPGPDEFGGPKQFDIDRPLEEAIIYDCTTGELIVKQYSK